MSATSVPRHFPFGPLGPVCRLGLATRGTNRLTEADVELALERGVNFLNWAGTPDALSRVVADLGAHRNHVVVCVQFEARSARDAEKELAGTLRELKCDCVDILTFYYVERQAEWDEIAGPGGALDYCRKARDAGRVRLLGLTSHQRKLAARIAESGALDLLMIRYNAAHRGAEQDIFPVTDRLKLPVVTYTSLRWGALLQATPDDPPGFQPPRAPSWYRFVLQNSSVRVALMAPESRAELQEDLTVLTDWRSLSEAEFANLTGHGVRVRRHAGRFP